MSRTKRNLPNRKSPHTRPKNLNERRQVDTALEEGVKVRSSRQHRLLPDAWDDKMISALSETDHH